MNSLQVPHLLSEETNWLCVEICIEKLALNKEGWLRLCDIVIGDESLFYHRKIGTKQSNKCWNVKGQSPKKHRSISDEWTKNHFCIFFRSTGLVHITYVDEGRNVDREYYIRNSPAKVISLKNNDRLNSGSSHVRLLHDNARPHIAKNVKIYFKMKGIKTIRHPSYSLDLTPSDFWLFGHIKQKFIDKTDAES